MARKLPRLQRVLEAPALGMSAAWGWVQPEVARRTRVCSYDRSGLGWSETGDRGFDPGHFGRRELKPQGAEGLCKLRPFARADQRHDVRPLREHPGYRKL